MGQNHHVKKLSRRQQINCTFPIGCSCIPLAPISHEGTFRWCFQKFFSQKIVWCTYNNDELTTSFRNTLKFSYSLKFEVSLLPKKHHQKYWKFTINNLQICLKTDTILIQRQPSSVLTCLCAMEFYLQMSQSNSFNGNDLMVLFNCRWSGLIYKLSLIRSLYLFASENIKMIKVDDQILLIVSHF